MWKRGFVRGWFGSDVRCTGRGKGRRRSVVVIIIICGGEFSESQSSRSSTVADSKEFALACGIGIFIFDGGR